MILEGAEVASAERRIRIGREEKATCLKDRALNGGLTFWVVRPDGLIELGDQRRYRSNPTEPQVVDRSLQRLARRHPAAEPLQLHALRLQQLAMELEQRPSQ